MDRRFALKNLTLSGMGLALSPALLSALEGCTPAYDPGYVLQSLSPAQDQLLAQLVEIIIPTTETPGARAAGVNQYIDRVFARVSEPNEKTKFLNGLDKLSETDFLEMNEVEQIETLRSWEKSSDPLESEFFSTLKDMTIYGYYTSEIGASQELKYVHATGFYNGDLPYDEIGKNFY
ncbi:MAG: gluconate 2-dehydrogenase subunit 3 family protein [Cyclobacteriaceae bacterium]